MRRPMGGREIIVGVDLGKRHDYSAIAVIDKEYEKDRWDAVLYCDTYREVLTLRHLEKVELRTAYPRVVERVKEVARRASDLGRVTVVVDATGVGDPVVDLMKESRLAGDLMAVKITAGEQTVKVRGEWHVPKSELMVGLQMMVARGRLAVARELELREELMGELLGIGPELKAVGSGHDDLAVAVALACWPLRVRGTIGERSDPLPVG